jgi:hypothetical protein
MSRSLNTAFAATALAALAILVSPVVPAAVTAPGPTDQPRQFSLAIKPWTGDFDRMLEQRMIRIDFPYSRSLYFIDRERERGTAAELVRDFERWVNKDHTETIGIATTTYVRNIFKYYASYTMTLEAQAKVDALKRALAPTGK